MGERRPDQHRRPEGQPQAGNREPPRPAQDAADDHEVGAREGERDEGEDAEAEQRPRRSGRARQGKPDKDADDEPLRAVAADEVEEIEDAAAEAVHAPPPEPRRRGGVNAGQVFGCLSDTSRPSFRLEDLLWLPCRRPHRRSP
jgi:hypothetical protein